ncbi:MAG TPA: hypothetical protein VIW45_06245 [Vicinamibacterales bacterium]|jgi:hypothetical protein
MAEVHVPGGGAHEPEARHETSDVNLRAILGFGAALAITGAFINFVVWLLFTFLDVRATRQPAPVYPLAAQQENRLPPEPRLQTHPREDLRELRAQEDQILTTYGWVDRNAGVVRVPIDQAMKMLVQRGVPVRQEKK